MDALPDDPVKLMSQIAALCSDLGLHDRALSMFRQLVVVREGDPNALSGLALAESRAGDPRRAIATLRQALERDPRHDMARVLLATHLHAVNDASASDLLRSVLHDARDPDARALAESVRDDILSGPAVAQAPPPADDATARPGRHRYSRLPTQA